MLPPFVPRAQLVTDLINYVYPREWLLRAPRNYRAFSRQVILLTLNDMVRELNQIILDMLSGQE
jgi:predicted YcjX-like family ATPase